MVKSSQVQGNNCDSVSGEKRLLIMLPPDVGFREVGHNQAFLSTFIFFSCSDFPLPWNVVFETIKKNLLKLELNLLDLNIKLCKR